MRVATGLVEGVVDQFAEERRGQDLIRNVSNELAAITLAWSRIWA